MFHGEGPHFGPFTRELRAPDARFASSFSLTIYLGFRVQGFGFRETADLFKGSLFFDRFGQDVLGPHGY